MAKKGFIKDLNNIEMLPITRGELVLDSSGKLALHSNEFLATDSLPGLMSKEDKAKLNRLNENGATIDLVSATTDGLAPKIGTAAASTVTTQADEWVLTSTKGATPTWRKLPTNAFLNYYRPILVNGTSLLGNNNTALNIAAGTNINLTTDAGKVTINNGLTKLSLLTDDILSGKYLPLTGGTLTGDLNIGNKTTVNTPTRCLYLWKGDGTNSHRGLLNLSNQGTSLSYWNVTTKRYSSLWINESGLYFTLDGSANPTLLKIWHERNDGSDSGLDADLLDGKHATDFLPHATVSSPQNNDETWINQYAKDHPRSYVYNNSGLEWQYLIGLNSNKSEYGSVLRTSYLNGGTIQIKALISNVWNPWKTVAFTDSNITGNAATSDKVYINLYTGNDVEYPILWTNANNNLSAHSEVYKSYSNLTYNPVNNRITATSFKGNLTGNAATADKLKNKVQLWGNEFDGSNTINSSMWFINNSHIYMNDASNSYSSVLVYNSSNTLAFGYGSCGKGHLTSIYGAPIIFFTGTDRTPNMIVGNNGNVGIGTMTPKCKLSVNPTTLDKNPTLGNLATDGTIGFGDLLYKTYFWTRGNGNGYILVGREDGNTSVYHLILQVLGGNVGIGTNNPLYKLDVNGVILSKGIVIGNEINYSAKSTNGKDIGLMYLSSSNNLIIGKGVSDNKSSTYVHGNSIIFRSKGGVTDLTMSISNHGNVTIGNSNLAGTTYKLYVNGNTNINGSLTASTFLGNLDWSYITNKPTSFTPAAHSHNELIYNKDLRNESTIPTDYNQTFKFVGIKGVNAINLLESTATGFVSLIGWRGYTNDGTGPFSWEMASGSDRMYVRSGNTKTWTYNWRTLAYTTDTYPTKQITALTGYTKATSASDLVTTDTLNIALGKLEYKAGIAYSWYRTITEDDTDEIINKWDEVVDFVNNLEVDLTDEFVTRKTNLTITGLKTFTNKVEISRQTNVLLQLTSDQPVASIAVLVGTGSNTNTGYFVYRGGTDYQVTNSGWSAAYTLLHSGNSHIKNGVITINGTSITPLTSHQSLANYVTLNTELAITGRKYFDNLLTIRKDVGDTGASVVDLQHNLLLQVMRKSDTHSIAIGVMSTGSGVIIAKALNIGYNTLYLNPRSKGVAVGCGDKELPLLDDGYYFHIFGATLSNSTITATKFIKSGGTSSQFLKADGSVDNNAYLPLTGGTLTGSLKIKYNDIGLIVLERTDGDYIASIGFKNTKGVLGYIGKTGNVDGDLLHYSSDRSIQHVIFDSKNYTNYINSTNFPGLAGVRSVTINNNYLRVNTNGTNADLTIPYAKTARTLSVASYNKSSEINFSNVIWTANEGDQDLITGFSYAAVLNVGTDLYRGWQIWGNRNTHSLFWRPAKSDASAWSDVHTLLDNYNWSSYITIPKVTDYYWANVKISSTSSTTTTPIFGALTLTTPSGIAFKGSKATNTMIKFLDNTVDYYGNGIVIGGGGVVIIGSGESSSAILNDTTLNVTGGTENTYITSDGDILFCSGMDTSTGRKNMVFGNSGNLTVPGIVTSNSGFNKTGSSNSYVLLGGGGHKAISDFLLKSEIANQELSNNLTTITKSLTVTADWMDTGIKCTDIPNHGTYIIQVSVTANDSTGLMYHCYWSGVMTWVIHTTNDDDSDEILLHRSGHAYGNTIYLRTIMTTGTDGRHLRLLIAANKNLGAAYTYTFKFKRII